MTANTTKPAEIHIHIGRVVVHGQAAPDPHILRAAVQKAIARALADTGDANTMADAMRAGPDALSRHCSLHVGQAVHAAARATLPSEAAPVPRRYTS